MSRPSNLHELAARVAKNIKESKGFTFKVSEEILRQLVPLLVREGLSFAKECFDEVENRQLRDFLPGTAGMAAFGATVGGVAFGPTGMTVGACVGAMVGLACATVVTLKPDNGGYRIAYQPYGDGAGVPRLAHDPRLTARSVRRMMDDGLVG